MNKQKINWLLYLFLGFLSIGIIVSSLLVKEYTEWFKIISGIGCGAFASVIIAFLIETANIFKRNKKHLLTKVSEKHEQEKLNTLYNNFVKKYGHLFTRGNNLAFRDEAHNRVMDGYPIYSSSLDVTDPCVRLERYMAVEKGGKYGWKIGRCYMMSDVVEQTKPLPQTKQDKER